MRKAYELTPEYRLGYLKAAAAAVVAAHKGGNARATAYAIERLEAALAEVEALRVEALASVGLGPDGERLPEATDPEVDEELYDYMVETYDRQNGIR